MKQVTARQAMKKDMERRLQENGYSISKPKSAKKVAISYSECSQCGLRCSRELPTGLCADCE